MCANEAAVMDADEEPLVGTDMWHWCGTDGHWHVALMSTD
ncbi:unnamed protein product, partial [Staurois parvus]